MKTEIGTMIISYRKSLRPAARIPPHTSIWRLLIAAVTGRLARIADRQFRHHWGIVKDPERWAKIKNIKPGPEWGSE